MECVVFIPLSFTPKQSVEVILDGVLTVKKISWKGVGKLQYRP